MKWFDNIKIAHKLVIALGGCVVFAALIVVTGIVWMNQLNLASSSIYQESAKGNGILEQIASGFKQYRIWQIRYSATRDPADWAVCNKGEAASGALTTQYIQDYLNHTTNPTDLDNAKALSHDWQAMLEYNPTYEKICLNGSSRDIEAALTGEAFKRYKPVNERLGTMSDWNTRHADQLASRATGVYHNARNVMIGLLISALAFAAVLASLVLRSIGSGLTPFAEAMASLDEAFVGLEENTSAISQGDFIYRSFHQPAPINSVRKDELGDLARVHDRMLVKGDAMASGIVQAQKSLTQIIGSSRVAAGQIAGSTSQLASGNEDLASRTSAQASSLEETAASMEEMTSIVKQSAEHALKASALAAETSHLAETGGEVVKSAVTSMQNINNASRRISDIVSVIDEIAFQTNLLALNAAVEAARVGEQGRGFAVVASEVRSLAGRSSTAAKEIKNLMRETMEKVESGTELVNQSGEQLTQIVSSVKKVAEFVSNISTSSQEQSAGIEQVNKALVQLEEITQQNAALVEETAAASQSVSQRATHLDRLVSRFKYDEKLVIDDDIDQPTAVSHTFQTPAKLRMVNGGTASDVVRE